MPLDSEIPASEFTPHQAMRAFDTGATRDHDAEKLDYDACLSPIALERFAHYMKEQRDTAAGRRADDNWQKGIPMDAYRKSMMRHVFDAWRLGRGGEMTGDEIENLLCAVLFNVQGWLHEAIKARR